MSAFHEWLAVVLFFAGIAACISGVAAAYRYANAPASCFEWSEDTSGRMVAWERAEVAERYQRCLEERGLVDAKDGGP